MAYASPTAAALQPSSASAAPDSSVSDPDVPRDQRQNYEARDELNQEIQEIMRERDGIQKAITVMSSALSALTFNLEKKTALL